MKINYARIVISLLIIGWAIFFLMFVTGCDTAKQSARHYTKFIEKGGVVTCDTVKTTIEVTIKGKDGKDSLIYVPVDCNCPDVILPKTRYQIKYAYRYDLKRQKARDNFLIDSLDRVNKASKIESKNVKHISKSNTKVARAENRRSNWWIWYLLGVICGVGFFILIFRRR